MALESRNEELIRKYLLGGLSDDELERVENDLLTDNVFSDYVLMIEDALVEDYAEGRLEGSDREKFEHRLLSTPRGREQVRLTEALREYA